jgi:short-subunit dehydrogenase
MSERGSGQFIFMGSVASVKGYPGGVAYCAAKHGLLGLARALREESKASGLRVTTLLPGATLTPSWDGSGVPEDRFMPAADIAQAVKCAVDMSGMTVMEEILLRPQPGDL